MLIKSCKGDQVAASEISRRQFAIGSSLFVMASGLTSSAARAQQASAVGAGRDAIDVHCHVFNASDLPIAGFLRRVVFEDYEEQVTPDALRLPSPVAGLIATLIGFLRHGVITAEEELERLRTDRATISVEFDPFSADARKALSESLQNVLSTTGDRTLQLPGFQVSAEGAKAFHDAVDQELRLAPLSPPDRATLQDPSALVDGLLASPGAIGRSFRWAAWLRSPRLRIVQRINELYGVGGRVGLFTPALVDYSRWLDEDPRSGIGAQLEVMEAIQKEALRRFGFAVHCLAPYDPWQQALDQEVGRRPSAFDLVREAIEKRGFIGVKLYPPMGFLPLDNADNNLKYPKGAETLHQFKRKIDGALHQLYAWAEQSDTAILAHATNSNAGGPDYGERASPKGWQTVLNQFPKLRLNLAHFGGFDEDTDNDAWENIIGTLLPRHPNVYADLSYLSEALPSAPRRQRARIVERLRTYIERFDRRWERLLYGSDWIMLGREADHHLFFENAREIVTEAGASAENWGRVARGNAIRFYGLSAGQPTRRRLETWYRENDLDAGSLGRFG
jgi:predicted TIM-barrel fold metal-dependent hydrolase